MRSVWQDILTAFVMGMVVPSLLVNGAVALRTEQEAEVLHSVAETTPVPVSNGISIGKRTSDGSVLETDMEQYIMGVVLAEMPASFEPEALKAQAVAARTYTAKAACTGGKHADGSICTDSTCCQAYIAPQDYLSQGGSQENLDKVQQAVLATAGQVLTYDGELIEATYFSCSGGNTEDAAAVWGTEYPYLVSVPSPGEEEAAYYRDTVTFTPEVFAAKLERELTGTVKDWIEGIVYTQAGSVAEITICGETYTGTRLRTLLGLRSAAFSVDTSETEIQITTKGYGHRVGMSQYGADAMAVQGSSYGKILSHYYPGTSIALLGIDENQKLVYHNAQIN